MHQFYFKMLCWVIFNLESSFHDKTFTGASCGKHTQGHSWPSSYPWRFWSCTSSVHVTLLAVSHFLPLWWCSNSLKICDHYCSALHDCSLLSECEKTLSVYTLVITVWTWLAWLLWMVCWSSVLYLCILFHFDMIYTFHRHHGILA